LFSATHLPIISNLKGCLRKGLVGPLEASWKAPACPFEGGTPHEIDDPGTFTNPLFEPILSGNPQVLFGTAGDDHICEYGFGISGVTITQFAGGDAGNDTIYQDCRGANICDQTLRTGDGNDSVSQNGGMTSNNMLVDGSGTGNKVIMQFGGPGTNTMDVVGGDGINRISVFGGAGKDTIDVIGGISDDNVAISAGAGDDTITYTCTVGQDVVHIDGGPGNDTLTIKKNQQALKVIDSNGKDICPPAGTGGTTITVVKVEHITLLGDYGTPICQVDTP
jgi:hypothetical protein